MREIKFRIFSIDKKMEYNLGHWTIDELINEELMQFTGLKDKNGVDVYEGDVTKNADGLLFIIGFKKGCFTSEKIKRHGIGNDWVIDNGARYDPCDSIVLGNIYENPELL